jgi:cytochrome P450
MRLPADPIAAVTHADPYPYYADLVARRPFHRDETLGFWVAASAAAVSATLTSPLGRVRPAAEPVPRTLVGSPAGEIFGQLVRMSDGAAHAQLKPGVAARVATLAPERIVEQADVWAQRLVAELTPQSDPSTLAAFAFRLPVYVIASLLGVAAADVVHTEQWVGEFVRALAPTGTPAQVEAGQEAAGRLIAQFLALLGRDELDAMVANTIGYLSQAYEATAGLIGNTVVALGREPAIRARVASDARLLAAVVREVVRHDPPVQNTRRFVAEAGTIGGQTVKAGDAVLVVLAAANRDPAVNPDPARFDPARRERQSFTFGLGAHACPGEALASSITERGVAQLLAAGVEPEALLERVRYRPSGNTRVPMF